MTPKLLSPEKLARALERLTSTMAGDRALGRFEVAAHIAALEAANAAILKALDAVAWRDIVTAKDEAEHDMAVRVSKMPHPGATILSEHARALVRARDEGLERAAVRAKEAAEHGCNPYTACTCDWESKLDGLEDDIRAMKETET